MIHGIVTTQGVPKIRLEVSGRTWDAVIDTGFNGDLELPVGLQTSLNARYRGRVLSILAGAQTVEEIVYVVDFALEGESITADATLFPATRF